MIPEPRQSAAPSAQDHECCALEPLLTAYFDGEATHAEKQIARTHLAECAVCTSAWSHWQSTRELLQNTPCAQTPPSLSSRVQWACRQAAAPDGEPAVEIARAELLLEETLFEAAHHYEPEPFTPVMRAFFPEVSPPADLAQRILQNTVGADVPRVLIASQQQEKVAIVDVLNSWLRPLRWTGAAVVPALAALLLMVAREPQTPPVSTDVSTLVPAHIAKPITKSLQRNRALNTKTMAPQSATMATTTLSRAVPETGQKNEDVDNSAEHPRLTALTSHASSQAPPVKTVMMRRSPRFKPHVTLVSQSTHSERAELVHTSRTVHASSHYLPQPTTPTTTLSSPPVRLASNFQEALADFGNLRNYGVTEVNGVVDDYRAAVSNDEMNANDEMTDDEFDTLM